MGRSLFERSDFLEAARSLAVEGGPANVTVDAIIGRLKAPKGSFYHRFTSRDVVLGELWLRAVLAYQWGFIAAIEARCWLDAALHTARWARENPADARLLLVFDRQDFVQGEWPAELRQGVADQAQRFLDCLMLFAEAELGGSGPEAIRRATFVLADAPIAAVKPHLRRGEPPPLLVDRLIELTFEAIARASW